MDIAKRLKNLREEKGYSLEELAQNIERDVALVKDWEDGKSSPNAECLIELGKVYGLSLDELIFSGSETPVYNEQKAVFSSHKVEDQVSKKDATMAKSGRSSMILFPILMIVVYLCLGLFMNLWHPGWIVLVAIPVYYILVFLLNKLGDNVDKAVDDYIETNEADKNSKQ